MEQSHHELYHAYTAVHDQSTQRWWQGAIDNRSDKMQANRLGAVWDPNLLVNLPDYHGDHYPPQRVHLQEDNWIPLRLRWLQSYECQCGEADSCRLRRWIRRWLRWNRHWHPLHSRTHLARFAPNRCDADCALRIHDDKHCSSNHRYSHEEAIHRILDHRQHIRCLRQSSRDLLLAVASWEI